MDMLENIKGIGPKTIEYLNKLEINNVYDLIQHYPFRFEVLSRSNIEELIQDDKIIIDGVIESNPTINRFKGNMNRMSFNINTSNNLFKVTIFNRAFMYRNIVVGKVVTLIGKYDLKNNTILASDILFGPLSNKPTIIPIYRTTQGLPRKTLHKIILNTLGLVKPIDYIPEYITNDYSFLSKTDALLNIHNPKDIDTLKKAMIRLKYEELFIFMLKINYLKKINKDNIIGYDRSVNKEHIEPIIKSLPFSLTIDQLKVLDEIIKDLNSGHRMNRLLQGDVGSGKTIVALLASYLMTKSKYQTAFMVPTELLANQHYINATKLFKDINIRLLTSSTKKKEKEAIYEEVKSGSVDILIGTHSLIQDSLEFSNLGLIITDEQHRFGVNQRNNLRNKGNMPDVLYMSATPIPRTYALTIYGDMDISTIKTLPKDKKPIITYIKSNEEIKDVLNIVKKQLDNNNQVYVVAPLIEDEEDKTSVKKLKDRYVLAFPNNKIEIIHGKLKQDKKDSIMKDFKDNKIDILISTTLIEVGIDVPNATLMVIHDADYFGLSQLHQLRGRVGRGSTQSFCILIGNKNNDRLKVMESTLDGFKISEADFELRGSGDLFGVRQSGELAFKIADIRKDYKILLKAKEDSNNLLDNKNIDDYPYLLEVLDNIVRKD